MAQTAAVERAAQKVTWTKVSRGEWGIRGPGLVEGSRVTVEKRGGERRQVVVGEVLTRRADGIAVARVGTGMADRQRPVAVGVELDFECHDCGECVAPGTQCSETGRTHRGGRRW